MSLARSAVVIVTLICWALTAYKLRDWRRDPRNPPLQALCIALATVTVSLSIQPASPQIDQLFGVLDLARVVSNCLTLASVTAAQAFLLYMTSSDRPVRRRVRRRVGALVVAVAAIVTLFVLTPATYRVTDPRVSSGEYYGAPFSASFMYVYLAFLGWSLTQVVILATGYARIAHRPLLRSGLRLITAGAASGLGYVLAKLTAVAAGELWPGSALLTDAIVVVCFTTSILLVLVGSTIPSWGPRLGLDRLWGWSAAIRDFYRLRPLWNAIHQVLPEIALLPPVSGPRGVLAVVRNASLRRVRVTVEILDGYAMLRPWVSARMLYLCRTAAQRANLTGDRLTATVEAAVIRAALHSRLSGQPPASDSADVPALPTGMNGPAEVNTDATGAASQVRWLIQVARAYRSPVVSSILAHAAVAATPSRSPQGSALDRN